MKSVSQCKDAAGMQWLPFQFRAFESIHKQVVNRYNPHMKAPFCTVILLSSFAKVHKMHPDHSFIAVESVCFVSLCTSNCLDSIKLSIYHLASSDQH